MKTNYIFVWETEDHEIKTKSAETLQELYRYALDKNLVGNYYKQVQVKVIEG